MNGAVPPTLNNLNKLGDDLPGIGDGLDRPGTARSR